MDDANHGRVSTLIHGGNLFLISGHSGSPSGDAIGSNPRDTVFILLNDKGGAFIRSENTENSTANSRKD